MTRLLLLHRACMGAGISVRLHKICEKEFTDEKTQDVNNMKIALASQPTLDDSIALNVNRIEKALASLRKKVDLVAFGESYLQGFNSLKWNFERDRTVAVSVDSQPIKMLRYTAKKTPLRFRSVITNSAMKRFTARICSSERMEKS